ncbi:carboxypeptidase-like regulatory domain-containing protein [Hyalangium versicolor]|uniref:carboxypeptidase-like regulatory domain-containing protein n=1 Tax=Hyalangium versicolor TaxID=2861190 RepID=UPI001CCB9B30|nr:carboxypeptidase-like regulatory domain-containing protein [Hyalangium versicolor]
MADNAGYRRTWRLRGLMDEYLVVRSLELHSSEDGQRIPANTVSWRLRGLRGDSAAERTLLEVYGALGGQQRSGPSMFERRQFLEQMWLELEGAFESGRLALLRVPRPVFILPEREKAEEDDWKNDSEPTSWVGIQLEDEEGEPVAGQRVRLKLPDGSVRERVSDDRGRIRVDGVPPGNCQVEFVGIDGSDWRAA